MRISGLGAGCVPASFVSRWTACRDSPDGANCATAPPLPPVCNKFAFSATSPIAAPAPTFHHPTLAPGACGLPLAIPSHSQRARGAGRGQPHDERFCIPCSHSHLIAGCLNSIRWCFNSRSRGLEFEVPRRCGSREIHSGCYDSNNANDWYTCTEDSTRRRRGRRTYLCRAARS